MSDKKYEYLDTIRFIAISAVILIHVVSGVVDTIPECMTEMQIKTYSFFKYIGAFGVPMFLMVSGILFLNPGKDVPVRKLFGKYIRRIILALVLFGTFFSILELISTAHTFKVLFIWQGFVNTLEGNTWAHMWYLYVLLGLYLILPALKIFSKHADKSIYGFVLALLLLFNSIMPLLEKYLGFSLVIIFPLSGIYIFYYLFGYFLDTYVDLSARSSLIVIGLIADIGLIGVFTFIFNKGMSYDSPLIVLLSTFIFLLIKDKKPHITIFTTLRPFYFGIYLVHTFFLNLAYKFFAITPLLCGGYCLIPVFWLITFALSLLSVWILLKVKPLKKYVL